MTCNCCDYQKMIDKLFYGVALTDEHMNNAMNTIKNYLVNGEALKVLKSLSIGWKELYQGQKLIKQRFYFYGGNLQGRDLDIKHLEALGHFLRGGYCDNMFC